MKTSMRILTILVVTLGLAAACSQGPQDEPLERSSSALYFWNPYDFRYLSIDLVSGHGLNGTSLNGKVLDGHMVVAVSLESVKLKKGGEKDLKLVGTVFKGTSSPPKKPGSFGVIGAEFDALTDDGAAVTLRVDDADFAAESPAWYRYAVRFATTDGWKPLCGTDEDGSPVMALPLNGVWEYMQGVPGGGGWTDSDEWFTFACEGFTLAKCVSMGYPPWAEGKLCDEDGKNCVKTTLAAHHQACSRALRADYCGDGTPNTVDGVFVSIYDGIGIRDDAEEWLHEAEWDEDGARCAVAQRVAAFPMPSCMSERDDPECGTVEHFEQGALLMTEVDSVGSAE